MHLNCYGFKNDKKLPNKIDKLLHSDNGHVISLMIAVTAAMKPKHNAKENTVNVPSLNSAVPMANAFLRDGVAIMKTVNRVFLFTTFFKHKMQVSNIFFSIFKLLTK